MPFAVSCRSCGARFSVADELYRRRFAGRIVTVRCKHCQATIRLDASDPPAKAAPKIDQRPKWVPKPAPPPPRPAHRQGPRVVALSPGLLDMAPVPREAPSDLFQTPPPSDAPPEGWDSDAEPPLDLTEYARSEPPPADAEPSDTPPLFELAHEGRAAPRRAPEDVDFLLGMRGNALTTAALVSPTLPTFEEPIESQPPKVAGPPSPPAPAVHEGRGTESEAPAPKRRWPVVALALGLTSVAAIAVLSTRGWQIRQDSVTNQKPADAARSEALPPEPAAPLDMPSSAEPPSAPSERADQSQSPPAPSATARTKPAPLRASSTPQTQAAAREASASEPATPAPSPARPPPRETTASTAGEPFDRAAAAAALAKAAADASTCRQEGDPSGTASATVTFAPSGRVTTATLSGPPFAGTKTGGCIAASLRRARVPAFAGEKITVSKTVVIR